MAPKKYTNRYSKQDGSPYVVTVSDFNSMVCGPPLPRKCANGSFMLTSQLTHRAMRVVVECRVLSGTKRPCVSFYDRTSKGTPLEYTKFPEREGHLVMDNNRPKVTH